MGRPVQRWTAIGVLGWALGCQGEPPAVYFTDATDQAGLSFVHENGAAGQYFLIETMGAGGALADFDEDGDLDVYLVDGFDLRGLDARPINLVRRENGLYWVAPSAPSPEERSADPADYAVELAPPAGVEPRGNALYRNEGTGTFVEVPQAGGAADSGYGMGVAVADADNDGDQDLYATNYGPNAFYRNRGDATFVRGRGVEAPQWSTSAAFFDRDNDGSLDLYVVNYLDFTLATNKVCGGFIHTDDAGLRAIGENSRSYCAPSEYGGVPDVLYHNAGDGTFVEVSMAAGIANPQGKGLGVVAWDWNEDGYQDLYVANDGVANFLYQNAGDGTFRDIALQAGVAYNVRGQPEAGMGVDIGDCDRDGDWDLFVTNFSRETNTLYRNEGTYFKDVTAAAGLGRPSWLYLGFGTAFFDYDHDGDSDLYVANGHVLDRVEVLQPGVRYAQAHQLFRNDGACRFVEVADSAGSWFAQEQISRGLARGDWDGDGDLDLLVTNCGGPAKLVRNHNGNGRHWASIKLVATGANRDAVGAEVRVVTGSLDQRCLVRSGSSYLSAGDRRLHVGLGDHPRIDRLEVQWPHGAKQVLRALPADRHLLIEQGRGVQYSNPTSFKTGFPLSRE